jgi:hypothetical protein
MALLQVVLLSIRPYKFVRPPYWYYLFLEIQVYGSGVVPNGRTSIPSFIQFRPAVFQLNHTDRQTEMTKPICVNFVQGTYNNVNYSVIGSQFKFHYTEDHVCTAYRLLCVYISAVVIRPTDANRTIISLSLDDLLKWQLEIIHPFESYPLFIH